MLQQFLITGPLAPAPAVQQPVPVETDGLVDLPSPVIEVSGDASGHTAPGECTGNPERKVAMTQPTVVAALLDLFDVAEPVRVADLPAVTREGIEAGRPLTESLPHDMSRTAVAEGVRENARRHSGNAGRAEAPSVAVGPGSAHDESRPKPVLTTATLVPDDTPITVRPDGQSFASVVDPFLGTLPEDHLAHGVFDIRQSAATSEQGAQARRAPVDVANGETRENASPDGKEKEVAQAKGTGAMRAVGTEGESRDTQGGRPSLSQGYTGTATVRSEGARMTDGGFRMTDFFQTLSPDTARDVMDQVVKGLALRVQGETSEVRIRLEPESLGEVVVHMRLEHGKLQAQIDVSQAGVKGVLEGNLMQLRQSLSTRGIEVQRLDVVFSGGSGACGSENGQGERQRQHGGRQPLAAEAVEQYQTGRLLGYNTMEMVM